MRPPLTRVAMSVMLLTACEPTPRLARNLPSDNAYSAFNQRLAARFPLGSPSVALVSELKREHFGINTFGEEIAEQQRNDPDDARFAEQQIRRNLGRYDFYSRRTALQGVCSNIWSIYYSVQNSKITAIHGEFRFGGCP